MSMKNSNDTIGNRFHDLSTCSAVPQPTAPAGATRYSVRTFNSTHVSALGAPYRSEYVEEYTKF